MNKTEEQKKAEDRIAELEEENSRLKQEAALLKQKAVAMEYFVDGYRSYVNEVVSHVRKAGEVLDNCMAWDNNSTEGFVEIDEDIHAVDGAYTSRWSRGVYSGWEHLDGKRDLEKVRDCELSDALPEEDEPDDADDNDTCGAGDEYREQCNNDCLDCPYWEDYWDE